MNFKEVQDSFFRHEEEKHKAIQETQKYFLKNKFSPYIWFDEKGRLRIKHKFQRGKSFIDIQEERRELQNVMNEFTEKYLLMIHFVHIFCEEDRKLPDHISFQWSEEYILEV